MRRFLAVPFLLLATSATAQRAPTVALAADLVPAIPLGEFADDGAELGWGRSTSVTIRLTRALGLYGSYERTSFNIEDRAQTWTDRGLGAGLKLWLRSREDTRIRPWAQVGIGWHDLDAPIAGPEFARVDTNGLRTIEGGAGVDIAVARRVLFVRPVVRYRRYSFEVKSASETAETTTSYLALGVGLVLVLGDTPHGR